MTGKVNPDTFDRMLVERGLSATEFCKFAGISSATVAKIHRSDPLDQKTIERIAIALTSHAVVPGITELLVAS